MAGSHYPIILACDADSFFVQVETLRNPALLGKAVAIQQHQDIIAANHAAKQAGVKKHMAPSEARAVLAKVGGEVVHVFCEEGLRVSYRPYRETSAALMRLLKRFPAAAVVERASIDEAYIQMHGPGASLPVGEVTVLCHLLAPAHPVASHIVKLPCRDTGSNLKQLLNHGEQLACQIRAAVKSELGITISVGVSCNKLLAKLACRMAKPDGVKSIAPGSAAMYEMLGNTSIDKLPGMGGRAATLLASQGINNCGALKALLTRNPAALIQLGLNPKKAALLEDYCKGQDDTPVTDKGPPHSFQVQMTLTPIPIPAPNLLAGKDSVTQLPHTSVNTDGSSAGGAHNSNMLQPLPVQGPDTRPRMSRLLHHMCRDLVSRVVLDRHQEGRWPRRLVVQLFCQLPSHKGPAGSGNTSQSTTRSTAFPTAALLDNVSPGSRQVSGNQTTGNQTAAQPLTVTDIPAGPSRLLPLNQPQTASVSTAAERVVNGTNEASDSRAPAAGSNSALVVSERLYDSSAGDVQADDGASNVLSAVHQTVEALVLTMLQKQPPHWVVTQVALSATNMVPYESASAPTIDKFITRTNPASVNVVGQHHERIARLGDTAIARQEDNVQANPDGDGGGGASSSVAGHKRDAPREGSNKGMSPGAENKLQHARKRAIREPSPPPRCAVANDSRLEACGRARESNAALSIQSQLEPITLTQVFAQIAGSTSQHDTAVLAELHRKLTVVQARSKLSHSL